MMVETYRGFHQHGQSYATPDFSRRIEDTLSATAVARPACQYLRGLFGDLRDLQSCNISTAWHPHASQHDPGRLHAAAGRGQPAGGRLRRQVEREMDHDRETWCAAFWFWCWCSCATSTPYTSSFWGSAPCPASSCPRNRWPSARWRRPPDCWPSMG